MDGADTLLTLYNKLAKIQTQWKTKRKNLRSKPINELLYTTNRASYMGCVTYIHTCIYTYVYMYMYVHIFIWYVYSISSFPLLRNLKNRIGEYFKTRWVAKRFQLFAVVGIIFIRNEINLHDNVRNIDLQ